MTSTTPPPTGFDWHPDEDGPGVLVCVRCLTRWDLAYDQRLGVTKGLAGETARAAARAHADQTVPGADGILADTDQETAEATAAHNRQHHR